LDLLEQGFTMRVVRRVYFQIELLYLERASLKKLVLVFDRNDSDTDHGPLW